MCGRTNKTINQSTAEPIKQTNKQTNKQPIKTIKQLTATEWPYEQTTCSLENAYWDNDLDGCVLVDDVVEKVVLVAVQVAVAVSAKMRIWLSDDADEVLQSANANNLALGVLLNHEMRARNKCDLVSAYGCGVLCAHPLLKWKSPSHVNDMSSESRRMPISPPVPPIGKRLTTTNCAKIHLAAHSFPCLSKLRSGIVHLKIVGADAAAIAILIALGKR